MGPGGLVLLPVVLGPANVLIKDNTTTQATVRYPARGVGTLWTADTRPARGGTIRLLGRHRAELLEALRSPATTTDLARVLDVTPSAVSQHLGILRESGLVTGERIGRTVLYVTTERGLTCWIRVPELPVSVGVSRAGLISFQYRTRLWAMPAMAGTMPSTTKAGRKQSPSGATARTPAAWARASAAVRAVRR
jgi:DNA-binding transcriptional ArsR family regulator